MPRGSSLTLSGNTAVGLFFIQRYRYLTINQFAQAGDLNRSTAGDQLLHLERHGLLGHFGNTSLAGHGKTPKVYYLTHKGWEMLVQESGLPPELIGTHKQVKMTTRWSPLMYHRLRTVDMMISAEVAIRSRPHLSMVNTFLEYRRVKRGNKITQETTDYINGQETSENRIIPDAAFIIENVQTQKRALFFLEMDMATERIVSFVTRGHLNSLQYKFTQYDRYLKSLRYRQTYAAHGEFGSFTMLFVTLSEQRVENVRREMSNLAQEYSAYYRFTTYDSAMGDFLGAIWKSRSFPDATDYPLVRDEPGG